MPLSSASCWSIDRGSVPGERMKMMGMVFEDDL